MNGFGVKKRIIGFLATKYWNHIDDKKIVFCNFFGNGYGCNPKYIAEELLSRGIKCKLVWLVKSSKEKKSLPPNIKVVKYLSLASFRELATAKVWINNQSFSDYIDKGLHKKDEQVYIQTYHGSLGIKRVGKIRNDAHNMTFNTSKINASMIDFLISNSNFESDVVYKPYFYGMGEICQFGHPRNDIFFDSDIDAKRAMLKQNLGIDSNAKVVLYVPTYRKLEDLDCYKLDFERITKAFEKRFGSNWIFLVRLHPVMAKGLRKKLLGNHNVMDVTMYSDIQELLILADCAITDYSSAIFDYILGNGFGFIFAKDYEFYNTDWGLYFPLSATPFPVAINNDELEQNILNFDTDTYRKKVRSFLEDKGCIEDGKASSRVADLIEKTLTLN